MAAISTSDNSKKQSHTFGVNGFRRKKKDKLDVETTEYAAGLATAVSKATGGDTITYLMGHRLMGFERSSDGAMFWFVTDALGTVRDVVRGTDGAVMASYEFSEYGQRIASSESGVSSQKTWVGGLSVQDEVADTGLMMMGHRFYDPGLMGRFLNRDPIGFRGGLNLFEYARSRPGSKIDPLGLEPGWTDEPSAIISFKTNSDHAWIEYQVLAFPELGPDDPLNQSFIGTMGTWPTGLEYNLEMNQGKISQATAVFQISGENFQNFWTYVNQNQGWSFENNCTAFVAGAWKAIGAGNVVYENGLGQPAPWILRDYGIGNGAGGADAVEWWERPFVTLKNDKDTIGLTFGSMGLSANRFFEWLFQDRTGQHPSRPTNLR